MQTVQTGLRPSTSAGSSARRRGWWLIAASALVAVVLAGYRLAPNVRGLGSMVDTFVPWIGLAIPVIALLAVLARSPRALAATLVPALLWAAQFGGSWVPRGAGRATAASLTVISHNLLASNPHPADSLAALTAGHPDLVALQEVTDAAAVHAELRSTYPYRVGVSTVGLWSRYPIVEAHTVDTGLGWRRALRAEVRLPGRTLAVYVVHLASLRPGKTALRDQTIQALADTIRADPARELVILGDFNTATTDRAFSPLLKLLVDSQFAAGQGPGFTWPAALPLVRLDHVLCRGLDAVSAGTVRVPGSDHRAVTASFA